LSSYQLSYPRLLVSSAQEIVIKKNGINSMTLSVLHAVGALFSCLVHANYHRIKAVDGPLPPPPLEIGMASPLLLKITEGF
jgi:hypothetical protein